MISNENRFLFRFAHKSIQRNLGRSFFIGFSVSLAVIVAVWVLAIFEGVNHKIEKSVVNTNTGFFQIQEPAFAETTDPSTPRVLEPEFLKKLQADSLSFSPELVLDGNITAPEGAASLMVLGIDPEMHKKFLPIAENIIEGDFLSSEKNDSVVIGKELAIAFKYKVGDQLVLNYQDVKGELRSELLTIKGIYQFGSNSFQNRFCYVNQSTWQKLYLNEDKGQTLFNRLSVMSPGLQSKPLLEERLGKSDLKLFTWRDLNPEMSVVVTFHNGMIKMFFLIIAIAVLMTILTPVQMLWQERYQELKLMNILGISNSRFWKMGIFEVFFMIFYSGIASTIILGIILGIQSKTGVMYDYGKGGNVERAGISLNGVVYPVVSTSQIGVTFAFILLVLMTSYVWAIYRTLSKLEAEL